MFASRAESDLIALLQTDFSANGDVAGARLTNEVQFLYDRELQWEQNIVSSI